MKMKNGILVLWIGACTLSGAPGHAIVFPDQEVRGGHEDENPDAISRFGKNEGTARSDGAAILHPISESSFEASGGGRAPASAGGRAPAGISPATGTPKKAALRELKKKKAVQEIAVIANEYGFFPSTVFVTEGLQVRLFITGASARSQCFMLDEFGVRRQVRSQRVEEVVFTPDQPGRYPFNCPMNGAKGLLVVRKLDLGERSPASVAAAGAESLE